MAFESRNGGKQQYFYLSCTKEGRSRKLYVGPAGAPLADVLDRFRRLRQAIQAAAQEAQNDYLQVQAQLQDLCDQVHLAEAATYLTRGYRRTARGTWTLRGGPNMTGINYPSYTPLPTQDEYEDLVQAAQHGDPEALGELRAVLLRHPQIWQSIGDLAGQVEAYLIDLVAGDRADQREALRLDLGQRRQELCGDHPSPLEKLLVDQILTTYLDYLHCQVAVAQSGTCRKEVRFWEARLKAAQKRHQAAVTSLARLRTM